MIAAGFYLSLGLKAWGLENLSLVSLCAHLFLVSGVSFISVIIALVNFGFWTHCGQINLKALMYSVL